MSKPILEPLPPLDERVENALPGADPDALRSAAEKLLALHSWPHWCTRGPGRALMRYGPGASGGEHCQTWLLIVRSIRVEP